MASTTDFKDWITFGISTEDFDEIHSLYNAILNCEEWGNYSCTERQTSTGKQYIVKCDSVHETLVLTSPKAKEDFLKHIEDTYASDLGIEGEYAFRRAMKKDD